MTECDTHSFQKKKKNVTFFSNVTQIWKSKMQKATNKKKIIRLLSPVKDDLVSTRG